MTFNIKKRRAELGLTLEQIGDYVGVGKSTVRKWENGDIENMKRDKIVKLSEILKISPTVLIGIEEDNEIPFKTIPVLSKISAGLPIYAEENIDDYTMIAGQFVKPGKEYFGLIVTGDSMDRHFQDGDIVIVEKESQVENGQVAVVRVNGYNATLKRVKFDNDTVILIPESSNPEHDVQIYTNEDEVVFYGKVVGMTRLFN